MSQNQKKIYFIENPEFSESDIEEIECGCFTWSNEIFDDTREDAKLHSVVKKIAHRAAGQDGMAMDVVLGIISEFSEKCIKLSVPCLAEDGSLIPSDELIAEYKNIEELIADGWGIGEEY